MIQRITNRIQREINNQIYGYLVRNVEELSFPQQQLKEEGYYSQLGQDKWIVEKLFPGKQTGTFIDIGANDGITFSNTYVLEKMGWNGIAVEPIPSVYEKLVRNRQCTTVCGCVAGKSGKERFRVIIGYSEMLSGLVNEYDSKHLKRIEGELGSYGGLYQDIEVVCYNLNELLENRSMFQVDYLSIDVEGAEYAILKSIDFNRFRISVIGVENNYADYRIPHLLRKRGFHFHSKVGDEFYQNSQNSPV